MHLKQLGAYVEYCDPLVTRLEELKMKVGDIGVNLDTISFSKYDAIIIVTDHSIFNYSEIQKNGNLIIDTRNVYRSKFPNVVNA